MSTIKELREKQQKLVAEAREFLEQIDGAKSADEAKDLERKYDAAMAEHDKLEDKVQRQERLEAAEKRMEEPAANSARLPDVEGRDGRDGGAEVTDEQKQDVFKRWVQFGADGLPTEQRQVLAELRQDLTPEMRAQSTSSAAGGYTIPEGFWPQITETMAAWGPMLDPGVTNMVTTATGNNLPWPTMDDTSNEGAILDENTEIGEQDITLGQKNLGAYMYTSKLIRVSYQLLQDSAFDFERRIIRPAFGKRIARAVNRHLTVGTGSSQPNGIVTGSGLGATASTGASLVFDDLFELEHSIDPAYRTAPTVRWMFHDTTLKTLRKMKDGQGNYLWQPADGRTGAPAQVLNNPYAVNQHMPEIDGAAKPIVFGDFDEYVVRRVREFTMVRLVERYAERLQVGFFAFARFDGELADSSAIKHLVMQSG